FVQSPQEPLKALVRNHFPQEEASHMELLQLIECPHHTQHMQDWSLTLYPLHHKMLMANERALLATPSSLLFPFQYFNQQLINFYNNQLLLHENVLFHLMYIHTYLAYD